VFIFTQLSFFALNHFSALFHRLFFCDALGFPPLTSSNTEFRKGTRNPCLSRVPFPANIPRAVTWDPVYKLVKQIPRGRVTTYGALAKLLRLPGGARTAGRAMSATPKGKGIPWHRVLGANGKLLIREPYASLQRKLLESEGVTVLESRVNIKKHLWQPSKKNAAAKSKSKSKGASR
jgi:methylated-DNA-protein-cysteine methyltransferase related protein